MPREVLDLRVWGAAGSETGPVPTGMATGTESASARPGRLAALVPLSFAKVMRDRVTDPDIGPTVGFPPGGPEHGRLFTRAEMSQFNWTDAFQIAGQAVSHPRELQATEFLNNVDLPVRQPVQLMIELGPRRVWGLIHPSLTFVLGLLGSSGFGVVAPGEPQAGQIWEMRHRQRG